MGPVIIETPRLRVRAWTPSAEDCDDFMRLATNPEVVRFITEGRPYARVEVEQFVARQLDTQERLGWCRWALELRVPGERDPRGAIGFCGPGCTFAPEIEIGWWLHYDLWGRGLATEAGRAVVDYCFGTVGFVRLICMIHVDNLASRRVAEKVGFEPIEQLDWKGIPLIKHEMLNPLPEPPRDARFVRECEV
jgi:ribosomal-protein-alanine N-acetyltransferase